jgi:hypothetical protein
MPYIKSERRNALGACEPIQGAGELNYLITQLLRRYWVNSPQNYQTINDISGAATEALAEFRRRIIVPYEENKIKENTDVY